MFVELLNLIATFAAVFFLCIVVLSVLRSAYAQYEERYLAQRVSDLSEMFLFVGARQLVVLTVAITSIGVVLGLVIFGPVVAVALGVLGILLPTILTNYYRKRRIILFERQL